MFFEDLTEQFAHEQTHSRLGTLLRILPFLAFMLLGLLTLGAPGIAGNLSVLWLLIASLLALLALPFWNLRRAGQVHCPHCHAPWAAFHREQIFKTRACPLCGWVLRSRLPPQARTLRFDPAKLPRVWLQGELDTAKIVEEPAPLKVLEADDEAEPNPYRAPAIVAQPSVSVSAASQGCLTAWWQSLLGPPRLLLTSRERILRDPHLTVLTGGDAAQQRERDDAFVRSQRRMAWMLLLCCHAPMLVMGALIWEQSTASELPVRVLIAVGGALLASLAGLLAWAVILTLSPRPLKRFWAGSRGPVSASTDPATGYHGIRIRLLHHPQQAQLPRVSFRYRCAADGSARLRIVNFEWAAALELDLPPTDAGQWCDVQFDLLQIARQSDPNFAGDELHIVAEPSAGLQCRDFDVLPRF